MKIFLPLYVLLILLAGTNTACKHTRYSTADLPENRLEWGSGGGFAGKETTYTLLENGQIFKHEPIRSDSVVEISSTKRRLAKSMFKAAEAAGLSALDFKHPANTYMFVGMPGKRVVWGDKNHPVGAPVEKLYHQLNDLVKK